LTGHQPKRTVLFNFLGNALNQPVAYSLGLRQQLHHLFANHRDNCAHGAKVGCIRVGGHTKDFIDELQRAIFCGIMPGNGWGHIEEPVIQGCIPVIIMPDIHVQLEDVLNVSAYSIRLSRAQLPRLVDILRAVPAHGVARMQAELAKVWERYTYSSLFKQEYRRQLLAEAHEPRAAHSAGAVSGPTAQRLRHRFGSPATPSERPRSFGAVEPRLSGIDATRTLVDLLGLRLSRRHGVEGSLIVDHGPRVETRPPLSDFHPVTRGVQ